MDKNALYLESYKNYLICNHFPARIKGVSPDIRRLMGPFGYRRTILDFACGPATRLLEFLRLSYPGGWAFETLIDGYDINQLALKAWASELSRKGLRACLLPERPEISSCRIIHCSHGFYIPEVRDYVTSLFLNSPDSQVLVARGSVQESVILDIVRDWGLESAGYWNDYLLDFIKSCGLEYSSMVLPIRASFPTALFKEYCSWIKNFVYGSGSPEVAEKHLQKYIFGDKVSFKNYDMLYVILK